MKTETRKNLETVADRLEAWAETERRIGDGRTDAAAVGARNRADNYAALAGLVRVALALDEPEAEPEPLLVRSFAGDLEPLRQSSAEDMLEALDVASNAVAWPGGVDRVTVEQGAEVLALYLDRESAERAYRAAVGRA